MARPSGPKSSPPAKPALSVKSPAPAPMPAPAAPMVTTAPPAAKTPTLTTDKIAMRAYEKWCQRGRPNDGNDMRDWLDAEKELLAESGSSQARPTTRRS